MYSYHLITVFLLASSEITSAVSIPPENATVHAAIVPQADAAEANSPEIDKIKQTFDFYTSLISKDSPGSRKLVEAPSTTVNVTNVFGLNLAYTIPLTIAGKTVNVAPVVNIPDVVLINVGCQNKTQSCLQIGGQDVTHLPGVMQSPIYTSPGGGKVTSTVLSSNVQLGGDTFESVSITAVDGQSTDKPSAMNITFPLDGVAGFSFQQDCWYCINGQSFVQGGKINMFNFNLGATPQSYFGLGKPDAAQLAGKALTYEKVTSQVLWAIDVLSASFEANAPNFPTSGYASFEPASPLNILPKSIVKAFHEKIGAVQFDKYNILHVVNCDVKTTGPPLNIKLASGRTLQITAENYVISNWLFKDRCFSAFTGVDLNNDKPYMLFGSALFKSYFVSFDVTNKKIGFA